MKIEVMWNQRVESGTEHLILNQGQNIEADGLAVGMIKEAAYRIQYKIICDTGWNTKRVKVQDLLNRKEITFYKVADGNWINEQGQIIESLHDCTDVDIMVTPLTNTLPIKRLSLALNESKEISVVYVGVPELNPQKLNQRYTYLSQDQNIGIYRYENLTSGFTSDLKVNNDGLVVDYPGIFNMAWMKR